MEETRLGPRPFALPEYGYAVLRFFHEGVSHLMAAKDQVWGMLPRAEAAETVPVTQNTMPSGEVVESNPVQMEARLVLKYDDIRSCNVEELAVQINSAAEQNLAMVMPHFFDLAGRLSQAAGSATDCGGKPFTFETHLASLEKLELGFDRDGNPEWPLLVVSPQMAKYLQSLPPPTPEQQQRLTELIERKRHEHHARRRHRKLH
jgi:hypothetical protein